jgi:hypothetical protein
MSLAAAAAVSVDNTTWTTVATVTGDGTKQLIGAAASCDGDATVAFEVRVQVNGSNVIAPFRVPAGQAGVVYDSPTTIPNAQACIVQVYHSAGSAKTFSATLFGS